MKKIFRKYLNTPLIIKMFAGFFMGSLTGNQVAVIVALALGVNPILDMFETMNNVTGDIVCTHVVATNEKLTEE